MDDTAAMTVTFFNQTYVKDALRPGESYIFYGKVEGPAGRRQMTNPVFEREGAARFTGCILPVYPLTAGISNNLLAGLARRCVDECAGQVAEVLPEDAAPGPRPGGGGVRLPEHPLPRDEEALELARRRLIFEELFLLSCGMALLRTRRDGAAGSGFASPGMEEFLALLPFSLTGAQRRADGRERRPTWPPAAP